MSGDFDRLNAFLEINGGGGGTDAQDWALMLLRMYLRWSELHGFKVEEIDYQPGEVAGIKSATIQISGEYAYGWLRSERGVHRLVRISPFNANGKRQTSFASISLLPEIDDTIEITIDDKDLRVDTYRSSGAGGQHVNKTDSAVRITHLPTGIAVACQNERSQHRNRERAMNILKAKLYELELEQQQAKLSNVQGEKRKIDFGSQIRSYVLHPYKMVKDLRTGYETSGVDAVLDGRELDNFLEAYLMGEYNTGN
jgi:peptide chain release factor 2